MRRSPAPTLALALTLLAAGLWLPAQAQTPAAPQAQTQTPSARPARPPPPPGMNPFAWYYPGRAQRMEIGGKAVMNCEVDMEGRFQDCRLVSETPEGYGFGEATLLVAPYFKIKPTLNAAGDPVPGGRIDFPLVWSLPQDDKPPAKGK